MNEFFLEWRLKKHEKMHQTTVKKCHFYNNNKVCPYEKLGCMYEHRKSQKCKYGQKCNRSLCQYVHDTLSSKSVSDCSNVYHPRNRYSNTKQQSNEESNLNSDDFESEFSNMICFQFCSDEELSGCGYHACGENDFRDNQGIDIKNIHEKYDPKTADFIQTFPCNVCDFKCENEDDIKSHVKSSHAERVFTILCLSDTCNFKTKRPEDLHQHMKENHRVLMNRLILTYTEKRGY